MEKADSPPRPRWLASTLLACSLLPVALPSGASAGGLPADRLELSGYGRVGVAWTHRGGFIQGRTFNLTGSSLGGRMEEGDYLETHLRLHLLPPRQGEAADAAPYADVVLTPALSASDGTFLSAFSNGTPQAPQLALPQAYGEVGNLLVPGLKLWAGARYYRGASVHLADAFYFNNLSGQGAGVQYGPLELAVLLRTPPDEDGKPARQRTVFAAQYLHSLESGHSVHLLAELHRLPAGQESRSVHPGWVLGIKGHVALGGGSFNDFSVRYGTGIANGGRGGTQTWETYGAPGASNGYEDAASLELVEHFLHDFGRFFSLNAYGILHWNRAATGSGTEDSLDFALGARGSVYLHEHLHLIQEASFQGLRTGRGPLATVVKLTLMPTLVPSGESSVWARPHLRLFYTLALHDRDALTLRSSPYLQTVSATRVGHGMGHILGTRLEWWF